MPKQRLRASRTKRQAKRATGATSDRTPKLAQDATRVRVTPSGKRREVVAPALSEADKRRLIAAHPDVTFDVVRRGRNTGVRAVVARYRVDPATLR